MTRAGRAYKLFCIGFLRSTGSLAPISEVNRFCSLFLLLSGRLGRNRLPFFGGNRCPTKSRKRIETRVDDGWGVSETEEIAPNRKLFTAICAIIGKNGVFGRYRVRPIPIDLVSLNKTFFNFNPHWCSSHTRARRVRSEYGNYLPFDKSRCLFS